MEANLLEAFIAGLIEISPIGFIFGGIAWGYVKAIEKKHDAHVMTIEKHVDEIREDKGRYYQLVVEQGATLNELTGIVKRQTDTIEIVLDNQQEQASQLKEIQSKVDWIDRHLS